MFIQYLGLEIRVKMMTSAPRVLFPRGLCFSVMGGWWWLLVVVGGLFSMQPNVTAFPRFGAAWVSGRPSFRLSHLKEALGQEAGRQGYSLETGRTWGPLVIWNQHTQRDQQVIVSVCPLTGWLPIARVIFGACSGHGLQTHTAFRVHPPVPLL